MGNQIKRLNRELVYKGSILDIYKDTMDVGNGKIEEWDYVAHRMGAACVLPVLPDGRVLTTRGTIEGIIGYEIAGSNGFGYDPIFYVPEYGKTTAELTPEQKNQVSHRAKALEAMKKLI